MIIWMYTVPTTWRRSLRRERSATSSTWSTTTATALATTRRKVSSGGSATGRTRPMGRWSSPRSFSFSHRSHWDSNFGQAENITISVSIVLISLSFFIFFLCAEVICISMMFYGFCIQNQTLRMLNRFARLAFGLYVEKVALPGKGCYISVLTEDNATQVLMVYV